MNEAHEILRRAGVAVYRQAHQPRTLREQLTLQVLVSSMRWLRTGLTWSSHSSGDLWRLL